VRTMTEEPPTSQGDPVRPLLLCAALIASASASAQTALLLSEDDMIFHYEPVQGGNGLCAFEIHGNYSSHDVPRPEWDLNIAEVVLNNQHLIGISAGAFQVESPDRSRARKPLAPITSLVFSIENDASPITATIVGSPSEVNAIKAIVDAEPGHRLFSAFSQAQPVTIALKYQDGTADTLQVRDWHDRRRIAAGKNDYFEQCLKGFAPAAPDTSGTRSPPPK
jgi:hypothetical protein